jgi:hypothetical protein
MKKIPMVMVVAMVAACCGCQSTKTKVVEGSVIGGLLGAAAGGIIGHQSGHGAEGALIGVATGAVAGGVVGSQMEKPVEPRGATPQTPAATMSVAEVLDLTRQGINEDIIIDRIRTSGTVLTLSQSDTSYLRQQGVSEKVIAALAGQ